MNRIIRDYRPGALRLAAYFDSVLFQGINFLVEESFRVLDTRTFIFW